MLWECYLLANQQRVYNWIIFRIGLQFELGGGEGGVCVDIW